jgi:hypothetical protein
MELIPGGNAPGALAIDAGASLEGVFSKLAASVSMFL